MGTLFVRALPVVLLTVVVFLNPFAWSLASTIDGVRLFLAIALLAAVAIAFIVSATISGINPMLETVNISHDDSERLASTPFADIPDPAVDSRLTRGEWVTFPDPDDVISDATGTRTGMMQPVQT